MEGSNPKDKCALPETWRVYFLVFLFLAGVFTPAGFGDEAASGAAAPPPDIRAAPNADAPVARISEILQDPSSFLQKPVSVTGKFRGWKTACANHPAITRSDWAIEQEGACLVVTGKIPAGLSPWKPAGEPVRVIGMVLLGKNGHPYLRANQVVVETGGSIP